MAFSNDWAFLRAALPELQNYIISKDIYRPLGLAGGVQIPQLTIGNVLLSRARLAAQHPPGAQPAELADLNQRIDQERSAWRANWAKKAGREYTSRLNLWGQYLRDLRGDLRAHASAYASEVRSRAVLHLLAAELLNEPPQNEGDQLDLLDNILRGLTQPGSFVWEPAVEQGFPPQDYWFLYVTVRK